MPKPTERLSHTDEIILVRECQSAEDGSRYQQYVLNKIVQANLGLVHKIVHKFPIKNASVTYDDLFQEGVAGLIHGVKKFDAKKGCRLSTYVYNWINAYVRRYFANHGRVVRLPVHITEAQISLNKQVEKLTHQLGRTPSLSEVTEVNADAATILNDIKQGLSLNAKIGDDSELEDLQADDTTHNFEVTIDVEILLNKLRECVSSRDFDILLRRYGLNGHNEHTLQEIACEHSITRARAHQIQNSLIKKLKSLV